MDRSDIKAYRRWHRDAVLRARRAGFDVVYVYCHPGASINGDFLSPARNRRSDEYGGSFERRMAFLGELLSEIRVGVGSRLAIGVRLNMAEGEPGGYGVEQGIAIAGWLQQTGHVDYLHLVMGTGWGYPSYIQTAHFRPGQWAEMAGDFRRQLDLPVVYAGRVDRPEVAEEILAAGYADMVAVGRAHLADAAFVAKAKGDNPTRLRPCIGTNDCINRGVAEGLPFACTVNPALGAGDRRPLPSAERRRRLLVVGGGPAGMQLAVTASERGHDVELWERAAALGGQVLLATKLPGQHNFLDLVGYLSARLEELGVQVRLGTQATDETLRRSDAEVIAIATGAAPRRPRISGVDGEGVCDMWQLLRGEAQLGEDVAIVVQEDHVAPLALGDMLGREGRRVTMFIQTNGPAPLVSRYSAGTLLGRLSEAGVRLVCMQAVTAIELPLIRTRHVYSQRATVHDGFDSVVLACGAVPEASLYTKLEGERPNVHVLGDAYAPRRIVFATQQGYELAKRL